MDLSAYLRGFIFCGSHIAFASDLSCMYSSECTDDQSCCPSLHSSTNLKFCSSSCSSSTNIATNSGYSLSAEAIIGISVGTIFILSCLTICVCRGVCLLAKRNVPARPYEPATETQSQSHGFVNTHYTIPPPPAYNNIYKAPTNTENYPMTQTVGQASTMTTGHNSTLPGNNQPVIINPPPYTQYSGR
uniref:uncharacterized protein LOC108949458 n=1 Tax=Ciona intestinalis TaxID=7719 RepID=UPI00089DC253|nr:uncharacterized protein LOC108949458 [Ciona intestinalis]|eukprot:XP_018667262.1 uncharacterized protein LOC108949458 [Ciona intestinalis]